MLRRQWQTLLQFLFPRETDTWLAVFRIGMGLQLVLYALFLRSDWHSLFSTTGKGLVGRELGEAIASFDSPLIPKLGWLVAFGQHIGLGEETVLSITWACLLCMGGCLLLGLFCRPAAIIAWFLHICAAESSGLLAYGADKLPYNIAPSSSMGQMMVLDGNTLDNYNNGRLTPNCRRSAQPAQPARPVPRPR